MPTKLWEVFGPDLINEYFLVLRVSQARYKVAPGRYHSRQTAQTAADSVNRDLFNATRS
jgi:hypothetical protein